MVKAFIYSPWNYVLWVQICPLNSYVEGQSPSTSECDLIWVFGGFKNKLRDVEETYVGAFGALHCLNEA